MSDWYPHYEETKTMDLRWIELDRIPGRRELEQRVVVREGNKRTEEWRRIETILDNQPKQVEK